MSGIDRLWQIIIREIFGITTGWTSLNFHTGNLVFEYAQRGPLQTVPQAHWVKTFIYRVVNFYLGFGLSGGGGGGGVGGTRGREPEGTGSGRGIYLSAWSGSRNYKNTPFLFITAYNPVSSKVMLTFKIFILESAVRKHAILFNKMTLRVLIRSIENNCTLQNSSLLPPSPPITNCYDT